MKNYIVLFTLLLGSVSMLQAQSLEQLWQTPPEESRPWVCWYWMQGAVSKEGITADLEAMKEAGIGGAYLMTIKGVPEKPFITPEIEQLSPLWWEMIAYVFKEAGRLQLKIGFHVCDGFAVAGGPWITPELSMQKVVWSQLKHIQGGKKQDISLPQPKNYKGYYKDIAVYAYPALHSERTEDARPVVTSNQSGQDVQFLADANSNETFRCEDSCWIQFEYKEPFTCRSLQIQPSGRNLQSQRLAVEASDDGVHFTRIAQLEPPRQGWQNDDFPMTHAIPPVTARYFRFQYNLQGTEPGSEDLDAAKWKQSLKIKSIRLSSDVRIHQYEGKNGSVWRVSPRTTKEQIPDSLCIDKNRLIDISHYVDELGTLHWDVPAGNWTILRMGHTSTGYTNATGGKGAGLECDKFNPEAIRLQFDSWFGKACELAEKEQVPDVLKIFHMDSWECGSQNWSPVFREEFRKRRGYDIYNYLPVMAGIPVGSAEFSEKVLHDLRQTIAELITDVFYKVMQQEAHKKNCLFSAESIAPVMTSDGFAHYRYTDIPMGEFWLQSPTHDKPNDIQDAVSGAHLYGKNIVQAEAFTQLRSTFTEYPEMLKISQDRNYTQGINRLVYHVYVQNPWLDRKPGMTLDGIGLYFQRDQTWWKPAKAWIDYAQRCQALLQFGRPVVDLAVFTGDELPRRSLLPDRLVPFLPGIFGQEKVEKERIRLANAGTPTAQMPVGVTYSSNTFVAEDWINPLRGYAYDCLNPDALAQAQVTDGQIELPSGMKYNALLVPGKHPMQPNPDAMTATTQNQLQRLAEQGARFIDTPYIKETLEGIERDFTVTESTGKYAEQIAYTHRQSEDVDVYFISNQLKQMRNVFVSLRVAGKIPELWNPVDGTIRQAGKWEIKENRTCLPLHLDAGESVFIVLKNPTNQIAEKNGNNWDSFQKVLSLDSSWKVQFDPEARGPEQALTFNKLTEWNLNVDDRIRYYSGTAIYSKTFTWNETNKNKIVLELEHIYNIASVKLNGVDCGTIWTKPYRLDISNRLKQGINTIEIAVSNTWANRMMGDEDFNAEQDENKRIWTNARYRLLDKQPVPSGLTGKISIVKLK